MGGYLFLSLISSIIFTASNLLVSKCLNIYEVKFKVIMSNYPDTNIHDTLPKILNTELKLYQIRRFKG